MGVLNFLTGTLGYILVTVLVITVASLLLAFGCIDAAMWWTAVAGAGAIFTVRGMEADHQQAKELRK